MFEAQLEQAKTFKQVVDALKDIVTDVNVDIGEEGLALQSMDSTHCCLISFSWTKDGFSQ